MSGDWAQAGMANVSARVRELGEALAAVAGQVPGIVEAVNRLNEDVDQLVEERADTGAALSRHDRELRELTSTVKRLATQVNWLEQHVRSTGSARVLDLDHAEDELRSLAATSEAGHRATDQLLTPFTRATLDAAVTDHRDAVIRHRAAVRTLLDACARLAGTERGDAAHRQARTDYLAARGARTEAALGLPELALEATAAQQRLTADDEERERLSATIAAGERADLELLTRLRTRLTSAVTDGVLLPSWLTGPLGPMPAAGSARRWTDVAAGMLAYRITYGITDPDDPLGELPDTATGHRRRWHADLSRGIRELGR